MNDNNNLSREDINSRIEDQNNNEIKQNRDVIISNSLKLIAKRTGALEAFMSYRDNILNNGPLSNKEKFLIALAITVALKSPNCIAVQSKNARDSGASEDEIIQTMLIAGLVLGNNPLNTAYSSYTEGDSIH